MATNPDSVWLPNSGIYVSSYGHRAVLDTEGVVHLSRFGAAERHLAVLLCTTPQPSMGMELRAVRFVIDDPTCLTCIAGAR
jgi:hypothetical protein